MEDMNNTNPNLHWGRGRRKAISVDVGEPIQGVDLQYPYCAIHNSSFCTIYEVGEDMMSDDALSIVTHTASISAPDHGSSISHILLLPSSTPRADPTLILSSFTSTSTQLSVHNLGGTTILSSLPISTTTGSTTQSSSLNQAPFSSISHIVKGGNGVLVAVGNESNNSPHWNHPTINFPGGGGGGGFLQLGSFGDGGGGSGNNPLGLLLGGSSSGPKKMKVEIWDMRIPKRPNHITSLYSNLEDSLRDHLSTRYGASQCPPEPSSVAVKSVMDVQVSHSGKKICLIVEASHCLQLQKKQSEEEEKKKSSVPPVSVGGGGSLLEVLLKGMMDLTGIASQQTLSTPITKKYCIVLTKQSSSSKNQESSKDGNEDVISSTKSSCKGQRWVYEFPFGDEPQKVRWDQDIDVLLGIWVVNHTGKPALLNQTRDLSESKGGGGKKEEEEEEEESGSLKVGGMTLMTFFVSSERGLQLQNNMPLLKKNQSPHTTLLGLQAPYFVIGAPNPNRIGSSSHPMQLFNMTTFNLMREFEGVGEEVSKDPDLKEAILTFSYHLSLNQLNKAYAAIKVISSSSSSPHLLWRNMCRLSVASGRVGVSEVCLSQMGHIRGVRMVRKKKEELLRVRKEKMESGFNAPRYSSYNPPSTPTTTVERISNSPNRLAIEGNNNNSKRSSPSLQSDWETFENDEDNEEEDEVGLEGIKWSDDEKKILLAEVAIQIGQIDDAEDMYHDIGRKDLSSRLFESQGLWDGAISDSTPPLSTSHALQKLISQTSTPPIPTLLSRSRLRSVHQRFGRVKEQRGDENGAMTEYRLADTHEREIPRMWYQKGDIGEVRDFVDNELRRKKRGLSGSMGSSRGDRGGFSTPTKKRGFSHLNTSPYSTPEGGGKIGGGFGKGSGDGGVGNECIKWWGGYLESQQMIEEAADEYEKWGDIANQVRLLCSAGDLRRAVDVVEASQHKAASYILARHLEQIGDEESCIRFYSISGKVHHAIRLAISNSSLLHHLLPLTSPRFSPSPSLCVKAGEVLEREGLWKEASLCYRRGEDRTRAIEMCLKYAQVLISFFDVFFYHFLSKQNIINSMGKEERLQCPNLILMRMGRSHRRLLRMGRCGTC